jgi:putative ABC transport system ATP-binding protein
VRDATKTYPAGDATVTALRPTSLALHAGELLLIVGPSGSGKTTLLSLLGCVIYPTAGEVVVNGTSTSRLNTRQLADLRLRAIGFVFQSFNLVMPLSAVDNVALPLELQGVRRAEARTRALDALAGVAMADHARKLPRQLSGGQMQRVAIARALVTDPPLVLCDEPSASLDRHSTDAVMRALVDLTRRGKALAVVTHDPRLEAYADRTVHVEDGRVTQATPRPAPHTTDPVTAAQATAGPPTGGGAPSHGAPGHGAPGHGAATP